MLTNTEFCNFHHPLSWKQSKMATKQNKFFEVCVKGIVCLMKMIAEIDTDALYDYFVRKILCCFFVFLMNLVSMLYINSAFFFFSPVNAS